VQSLTESESLDRHVHAALEQPSQVTLGNGISRERQHDWFFLFRIPAGSERHATGGKRASGPGPAPPRPPVPGCSDSHPACSNPVPIPVPRTGVRRPRRRHDGVVPGSAGRVPHPMGWGGTITPGGVMATAEGYATGETRRGPPGPRAPTMIIPGTGPPSHDRGRWLPRARRSPGAAPAFVGIRSNAMGPTSPEPRTTWRPPVVCGQQGCDGGGDGCTGPTATPPLT
jgi:hypothetical protein